MEPAAKHEKIVSDVDFPIIAQRTLVDGPQLVFGGHFHSQFELLYIRRGCLELHLNAVSYPFRPGEFAIINPYDIHTAYSGPGLLYYECIILDPSFLSCDIRNICTRKYMLPFHQGDIRFQNQMEATATRVALFRQLFDECMKKDEGYELAAKGYLLQLFLELYRQARAKPLIDQERLVNQRNAERFQALFQYMEDHYSENLTLHELSQLVSYSPYHFSRTFHLLTGRTPTDYLRGLRMKKAVQHLRSGATVAETAMLCGFNSPNYFCKVFHHEFGHPPSDYRPRA